MLVTSILQFLDKTAINYANLFGIRQNLNLTGNQFSWLASIFYFGYLFAQFPMAYLMTKYSSGKVMGICTVLWGITVLVFAWTKNFAGTFPASSFTRARRTTRRFCFILTIFFVCRY